MKFVTIFKYSLILLALAASGMPTAIGQTVLARAEADPSVVMVGESSTYSIRFLNTDSIPNLNTPRVAGLEFSTTPSTSSYRQIINGRVSIETELSWTFRPVEVGNYTIPGRVVEVRGEQLKIPDVEVRAVPMDDETRSRALLVLDLPDQPYVVGQALPAQLSLLVRRDINISSIDFPQSEGEAFLHTEFSNNPRRGTVQYLGRSYSAVVWNIIITPIKAGPAELRFRQNLAIQVISRNDRFPSIFSMSSTRTEPITVFSDVLATDILPLPDNQPEDFSGAIGSFEVSRSFSSTQLTTGEPLTLTLTLKGEGNFERIAAPTLPEWENWRIYPPKVSYQPDEDNGYQGTKSFEYILIPQSVEITEIPSLAYSTFNPDKMSFETTDMEAIPVTVEQSDQPLDSTPLISALSETENNEPQVPERILGLKPEPGKLFPSGSIAWKETRFWLANCLTGLVLACAAWWLHRRNRLKSDVSLAKRHAGGRKVRKAMQSAQTAVKNKDVESFIKAMRTALQESISHYSDKPVEAATLVTSDCTRLMASKGLATQTREQVEELLSVADAYQFAGLAPAREDLDLLLKQMNSVLSELNRFKK